MSAPLVHITHLNLRYQQKLVLNGLNWTILPAENWLIRGASGSGKTSLAKAIAGLIPYQGKIEQNFAEQGNSGVNVQYVSNWYQFKDRATFIISNATTNRLPRLRLQ
jgi:molybdate transport system ATP-binding protein